MIEKAEQIAWYLSKRHGAQSFAWVESQGKIYYAVMSATSELPATAVTQLIQYLFDDYVDHSFFILRQRIFSNKQLSDLCRAMVRVTAKRVTGNVQAIDHGTQLDLEWICLSDVNTKLIQSKFFKDEKFESVVSMTKDNIVENLKSALASIERGQILHDYNRSIAAILCDSNGSVLEIATNNNSKNKTLHAEVCLIQNFFRRTENLIPVDSVIYSSLKPCKMCSEIILKFSQDPKKIQVHYLQEDHGPLAKKTSLEEKGLLFRIAPS